MSFSVTNIETKTMPANPYTNINFEGKQDDEVILYVIHPHWLMLIAQLLKVLLRAAVLLSIWFGLNISSHDLLANLELRGYIFISLFITGDIVWQVRFYNCYRGFITDRRIVVVKSLFPITMKRMTLFWKDAAKARDMANNFVWRMMKIGTLEISAQLFQGFGVMQNAKGNPLGSEIQMRYVKYFVEIASYIDSLIHLTAHHPEKIEKLKPLTFGRQHEVKNASRNIERIAYNPKQS